MRPPAKIVVASQHYPPDPSTTAAIMAEIACRLAQDVKVVVLSGTPGALPASQTGPGRPVVISVKNRQAGKAALVRRGAANLLSDDYGKSSSWAIESYVNWSTHRLTVQHDGSLRFRRTRKPSPLRKTVDLALDGVKRHAQTIGPKYLEQLPLFALERIEVAAVREASEFMLRCISVTIQTSRQQTRSQPTFRCWLATAICREAAVRIG